MHGDGQWRLCFHRMERGLFGSELHVEQRHRGCQRDGKLLRSFVASSGGCYGGTSAVAEERRRAVPAYLTGYAASDNREQKAVIEAGRGRNVD
jgi:hypothetical protein